MEILKKLKELLLFYKKEDKSKIKNKFGDVIFAEYKYEDITERNGQIRIAPFIVLEDCGDELLCVKGSSKVKNNVSKPKILRLKSDKYNLNHDTYFYLSRIRKINKSNLLKKVDSLSEKDELKLLSKLNILINRNYTFIDFPDLPEYNAKIGDVISKFDGNYLIVDEIDNKYYCLFLKPTTNIYEEAYVDLDGHYYHINLDVIFIVDKNSNKNNIIGDVTNNELLNILNYFKNYHQSLENRRFYADKQKLKKLS